MGTPAPSAPLTISASALALAVGLPRAFAQAGAPSLAALHLARLRLANELPAGLTTALCCPACSALGGLSTVRLVRSRRAKARAKKTKAPVANSRVLRCNVCAFELREPGSDRPTVDAFPSARKVARSAAIAAAAAILAPQPAMALQPTLNKPAASSSRSLTTPELGRPSPSPLSVRPSPLHSTPASPALSARASPSPASTTSKTGSPAAISPAAPPAASAARKKKPQTTLQKMLALNQAREEADAAAKKSGGGLLDWM